MLDIGWSELLVIAVVLIVVVGPKDLPPMLRAFGKMTARLRKTASEFQAQFQEALREADLDDVRQSIQDVQRFHPANALREAIDPLRQMGQDLRSDLQRATTVEAPDPHVAAADAPAPEMENPFPANFPSVDASHAAAAVAGAAAAGASATASSSSSSAAAVAAADPGPSPAATGVKPADPKATDSRPADIRPADIKLNGANGAAPVDTAKPATEEKPATAAKPVTEAKPVAAAKPKRVRRPAAAAPLAEPSAVIARPRRGRAKPVETVADGASLGETAAATRRPRKAPVKKDPA